MAKSLGFFGLRRGSTKSLTFSVLEGKQITKDRVTGGKNPRSNAQMQQRMCMATASAAYAAMKRIVDHSFEGYSYGRNNMSRFISLNTKALKDNLGATNSKFGYNPYGDRQLKQGAYIMSEGNATDILNASTTSYGVTQKKIMATISVGKEVEGAMTVNANIMQEAFGVKTGDMATLVGIAAINGQPANEFFFVRLKFLKGGTTAITSDNLSEFIAIESDNTIEATIDASGGYLSIKISARNADGFDSAVQCQNAWIHSVKGDGYWLRNNTSLSIPMGADFLEHEEDAIATYPVGETYILNGGAI